MGFSDCSCYWPLGPKNWASVLGQCQGLDRFTRLTFSLGLTSGPARLFFKPYQILKMSFEDILSIILKFLKNLSFK